VPLRLTVSLIFGNLWVARRQRFPVFVPDTTQPAASAGFVLLRVGVPRWLIHSRGESECKLGAGQDREHNVLCTERADPLLYLKPCESTACSNAAGCNCLSTRLATAPL
jgi:hypothetical protein